MSRDLAGTDRAGRRHAIGRVRRDRQARHDHYYDGTLQVTYNGLPLYFFKNDQAPGDANGVYENWEAVKP